MQRVQPQARLGERAHEEVGALQQFIVAAGGEGQVEDLRRGDRGIDDVAVREEQCLHLVVLRDRLVKHPRATAASAIPLRARSASRALSAASNAWYATLNRRAAASALPRRNWNAPIWLSRSAAAREAFLLVLELPDVPLFATRKPLKRRLVSNIWRGRRGSTPRPAA